METSCYTIKFENLPEKFDNFKIIYIFDLHSKEFGKGNKVLLDKIAKENPSLILITGDIIDRKNYNKEPSLYFAEQCVKISPIYCIGTFEKNIEYNL